MRRTIAILMMLTPMISGCTKPEPEVSEPVEALQVSAMQEKEEPKEPYQMFVHKADYPLSLYEPSEGCYLGADITTNKRIDFDIHQFETLTKKKQCIFSYDMDLNDSYPLTWILSCISQIKTASITITPPSGILSADSEKLTKLAQNFGEFYVPIFVNFYPIQENYDPKKYIAIYKQARTIFKEHASNVSFVWSVDSEFIFDSAKYYPGNDYVDWVGINLQKPITTKENEQNIFNTLDYFYYEYQKTKPIMITGLAISHFSSKDHIYRTTEASREIESTYHSIIENYPRVKAIIYSDVNEEESDSTKKTKNNYSITDDETVLNGYSKAINKEQFLTQIELSSADDKSLALLKSPFTALKIGDDFYISEKAIQYDTAKGLTPLASEQKRYIDGQPYYTTEQLTNKNFGRFEINSEKQRLTFYE